MDSLSADVFVDERPAMPPCNTDMTDIEEAELLDIAYSGIVDDGIAFMSKRMSILSVSRLSSLRLSRLSSRRLSQLSQLSVNQAEEISTRGERAITSETAILSASRLSSLRLSRLSSLRLSQLSQLSVNQAEETSTRGEQAVTSETGTRLEAQAEAKVETKAEEKARLKREMKLEEAASKGSTRAQMQLDAMREGDATVKPSLVRGPAVKSAPMFECPVPDPIAPADAKCKPKKMSAPAKMAACVIGATKKRAQRGSSGLPSGITPAKRGRYQVRLSHVPTGGTRTEQRSIGVFETVDQAVVALAEAQRTYNEGGADAVWQEMKEQRAARGSVPWPKYTAKMPGVGRGNNPASHAHLQPGAKKKQSEDVEDVEPLQSEGVELQLLVWSGSSEGIA